MDINWIKEKIKTDEYFYLKEVNIMEKKCNFCGNKNIKQSRSDYIYRHNKDMMIFKNVPCEVCEFCGEKYYDVKVLKKIENSFIDTVINARKNPQKTITVPVEEFVA